MKSKGASTFFVACVFISTFFSFFSFGGKALGVTVHLKDIDSGLTSPAGNYRWLDVANQGYWG